MAYVRMVNTRSQGYPKTVPPKCVVTLFRLPRVLLISGNAFINFNRRFKILYLFGHPRANRVFSKLQGPQYYFTENFRCNLKFYESKNLSDSSLHLNFASQNCRFPFYTKNSQTWGVKCVTI